MFKEKEKFLLEVASCLKQDFCGLDDIIDRVINVIAPWYIMPELQRRPLVVNLWGLTGVGKTDLVRKLAAYLDFNDRYLELHIPSYLEKSNSVHLHDQLSDHGNIHEGGPGILLLDEFQGLRSIDESGNTERLTTFQDVWQLLSDGMINNKEYFIREIAELYLRFFKKGKTESADIEDMFAFGIWDYNRFREILGLRESLIELSEKPIEFFKSKIIDAVQNPSKYLRVSDYTKLLIFISGNLDQAYPMTNNITDVDLDPDIFYSITRKINIIDIKKCLQQMFKPEQISRLGNIHIIYPSFNKQIYNQIINKTLRTLEQSIKEQYDLEFTFDATINEFIFRNGIFPVQGTRPVFSTIAYCIEANIPRLIIDCLEQNKRELRVSIRGNRLNGIEIPMDIEKIRAAREHEDILAAAVHEAGHVLASCILKKSIPSLASAKSVHCDKLGFVIEEQNNTVSLTRQDIIANIHVGLAGRAAEIHVFGKEYLRNGSSSDLGVVTELALNMFRIYGMQDYHGWVNSPHIAAASDQDKSKFMLVDKEYDLNDFLAQCTDTVIQCLEEHKESFQRVFILLYRQDVVTGEELRSIFKDVHKDTNLYLDKVNAYFNIQLDVKTRF